jgi:hypothetical protein
MREIRKREVANAGNDNSIGSVGFRFADGVNLVLNCRGTDFCAEALLAKGGEALIGAEVVKSNEGVSTIDTARVTVSNSAD